MKKVSTSFFRNRIENHLEEVDLDVVCRKRKSGYALYWDDDDLPIAKLRPTGRDDEVEVYSWEDDRWQKVAELEETLPLDEALEYITDDPDDVFFDGGSDDEGLVERNFVRRDGVRMTIGLFLVCAAIGGAVGGMFSSPVAGAAWGALTGFLCAGVPELFGRRIKKSLICNVVIGIPATIPAAVGGVLGASLHGALGTGIGWLLCSVLVGFLCGLFLMAHRLWAWAGGFAAGVVLGTQLVEAFGPASDTFHFALVAVIASIGAKMCCVTLKWFDDRLGLAGTMEDAA